MYVLVHLNLSTASFKCVSWRARTHTHPQTGPIAIHCDAASAHVKKSHTTYAQYFLQISRTRKKKAIFLSLFIFRYRNFSFSFVLIR